MREPGTVPRISPPWAWFLFWLLTGLFATALLIAVVGRISVHSRGRGILRPTAGVRVIQAPVAGVISEAFAKNGDLLPEGGLIGRIEAPGVQASMVELERQLQFHRTAAAAFGSREEVLLDRQIEALRLRMRSLEQQVESAKRTVVSQERRVKASDTLHAQGLLSSMAMDEAQEALDAARRQLDANRSTLAQAEQDLAAVQTVKEKQVWQRQQEVQTLSIKRDALQLNLDQTLLKAPCAGYLDALLVRPGDNVQASQPLAKVVPVDSRLQVISFVEEKDRAYLKVGDTVSLELDAYPYAEFGLLRGRIDRIGGDLASVHEVREALGDGAHVLNPSFRVEITVLDQRPRLLERVPLRPGMLMQVRYTLRRQRLITLVLTPLRKWLG